MSAVQNALDSHKVEVVLRQMEYIKMRLENGKSAYSNGDFITSEEAIEWQQLKNSLSQ